MLGAASFIILPKALEMLDDVSDPVGPEMSSITICWVLGQLCGGIFVR